MDVNCPYCDAETEICHDDGRGYDENEIHHQYCPKCENTFAFETTIVFYYEAKKADCLNGGKHNFKFRRSHPIEFSKMRCEDCGEERALFKEERKLLFNKK